MTKLSNLFPGGDEYLDPVIILPVGSHGTGSYNLPAGDQWTDYESVEFYVGTSQAPEITYGETTVSREAINNNPDDFQVRVMGQGTSGTAIGVSCTVTATGVGSFDIGVQIATSVITQIKAYKKKYGTRNHSKVVSVNGGADITSNYRDSIDIASLLGTDYLNRDLIVEVELYISGTAYTGWGRAPALGAVYNGAYFNAGVDGVVRGDGKIDIIAGANLVDQNIRSVWMPNTAITSAPCQVKVWKVDEYLPATKSSGDITTIWTGSAGNGVTVDWSGTGYTLSQFDDIKAVGRASGVTGAEQVPPSVALSTNELGVSWYIASTSNIRVSTITETSLLVTAVGASTYLEGIYGINYK